MKSNYTSCNHVKRAHCLCGISIHSRKDYKNEWQKCILIRVGLGRSSRVASSPKKRKMYSPIPSGKRGTSLNVTWTEWRKSDFIFMLWTSRNQCCSLNWLHTGLYFHTCTKGHIDRILEKQDTSAIHLQYKAARNQSVNTTVGGHEEKLGRRMGQKMVRNIKKI